MNPIIGIDLGTTNSAVAILEGEHPVLIPNSEGHLITPSVVAITEQHELLVGEPAKRQAVANPKGTVSSIKRRMGTAARVNLQSRTLSPEEISALIIQRLKRDAERYLDTKITQAVITVPAYFEDSQRQATKNAGVIAGLEVLRIINEPTAAALAYGINRDIDQRILVYDLGGGTFDVSILEVNEGIFQVLATKGDNHLGGDDLDRLIIDHLVHEFGTAEDIDLTTDLTVMQMLKANAERAKMTLSEQNAVTIAIPFVAEKNGQPVHLHILFTREEFETMIRPFIDRTLELTRAALEDAALEISALDKLLLVGGSTYIPMVRRELSTMVELEPDTSVHPERCVAIGAAIQASILAGVTTDVVLVDVAPLSLGVETTGGIMTTIIKRNTSIPCKQTRVFSTSEDNQTSVDIHVLQGERSLAKDNVSLGTFTLDDILIAPRGFPEIEVTFDIDANGIMQVSAIDLGTGAQQHITISGTTRLTKDEIQRMIEDAITYASEDDEQLKNAAIRNFAKTLIYHGERILTLGSTMFEPEKIDQLRESIADVQSALQTVSVAGTGHESVVGSSPAAPSGSLAGDLDGLKQKIEVLNTIVSELSHGIFGEREIEEFLYLNDS